MTFAEAVRRDAEMPTGALFNPPVFFIKRPTSFAGVSAGALFFHGAKQCRDFLVQTQMVAFQSQHLISLFLSDAGGNLLPRVQGLNCHHRAFEVECFQ